MNTLEIAEHKGKKEGIKEGKNLRALEVATRLLQDCPQWTNRYIGEISSLPETEVKKLREKLAAEQNGKAAQN